MFLISLFLIFTTIDANNTLIFGYSYKNRLSLESNKFRILTKQAKVERMHFMQTNSKIL